MTHDPKMPAFLELADDIRSIMDRYEQMYAFAPVFPTGRLWDELRARLAVNERLRERRPGAPPAMCGWYYGRRRDSSDAITPWWVQPLPRPGEKALGVAPSLRVLTQDVPAELTDYDWFGPVPLPQVP